MNPGVCKETAQYIRQVTTLLTYCWNDINFVDNEEIRHKVDNALHMLLQASDVMEKEEREYDNDKRNDDIIRSNQ